MSSELNVFMIENADPSRSAAFKSFSVTTLPHPRDGPSLFLVQAGSIYEYQKATPRKLGCFFIDQRISSNSTIYVATCVDPRFLLLPFLEANAKGRYSPLDQILTHVEGTQRIPLDNVAKWKMNECCDVNDKFGDDMILYRYNEEKTIQWLRNKVMRTAALLKSKRLQRAKNENKASVDTFNIAAQGEGTSISDSVADSEPAFEDVKEALDMVTDYISDSIAEKVAATLPFAVADLLAVSTAKPESLKRKADWELALEVEKETTRFQPSGTGTGPPPPPAAHQPAKPTAAAKTASEKKAAAPPAGTKSISSFFAKKV